MLSSQKLTCKGTLRQVFICLRPPTLLGFCYGWSSNFLGSESSQIKSVKLLENMVSCNRTRHPHPPPGDFNTGKGEGEELDYRGS
jgi:hypothetical protein